MIRVIQNFIIKKPVAFSMLFIFLILFGIISLRELKINLLPEIEYPKVTIITAFPNSTSIEVENLVTKPITEAVGSINGIEKIDSKSVEGCSFITLQFKHNKNINFAIMEIREKIDFIKDILPYDSNKSIISRYDPNSSPIMEIVFFSKKLNNPKNLRTYLNDNIKPFLERVDGVASIQLSGGYKKEVIIDVDPDKLNSYNISILDIKNILKYSNMNYPAGQIPIGNKDMLVRTVGEFKNISDIENIIVRMSSEGAPIYLSEFSAVYQSYKEKTEVARYNGIDSVIINIYKESSKNTVEISENIKTEIEKLKNQFGKDISIEIVYDQSIFTRESIYNLLSNLATGSILAFIALFLILRNIQSPFVLLFAVPASIFPTFIIFYILNISLNLMSLGGLTLGIGMLFDNSNVVLSAIERNLSEGLEIEEAIIKGTAEVTSSIISATLTTIIVFLPIEYIKNIIGIVFSEMAKSIIISLSISLFVSLSLIPLMASILYKKRKFNIKGNRIFEKLNKFESKMNEIYENSLEKKINNPKKMITIILILFICSVVIVFKIKKEYIPKVDNGEFTITIEDLNGFNLSSLLSQSSKIEFNLLEEKNIKSVISNIGSDGESISSKNNSNNLNNKASIRVILKDDRDESSEEFIRRFRKKIIIDKNYDISFRMGGDIISKLLGQNSAETELLIIGNDLDELSRIGKKIKKDLTNIPGVMDIKTSIEESSYEWKLNIDSIKMAKFNLTTEMISSHLKTAINGDIVTKIRMSDYESDIRIKYREEFTNTIEKFVRIAIKSSGNNAVEILQFANIAKYQKINSIIRHGNSRVNLLTANIDPQSDAIERLEKYISDLDLPQGYKIQYSGDIENLKNSSKELTESFLLTILLIYMLLSAQFESIKYSFIMLFTIPLIFIGTFPALYLTGKSFNVSSFMGIILLVGVVVDNASLIFEYIKIYLKNNSLKSSILKSAKIALKPILMNNSTTILGLLPVVLGLGKGGEFQAPMGVVVVSGLISSVLLSLYLIPILFYHLMKNEIND